MVGNELELFLELLVDGAVLGDICPQSREIDGLAGVDGVIAALVVRQTKEVSSFVMGHGLQEVDIGSLASLQHIPSPTEDSDGNGRSDHDGVQGTLVSRKIARIGRKLLQQRLEDGIVDNR